MLRSAGSVMWPDQLYQFTERILVKWVWYPIYSHFHQYRTFQTNHNGSGVSFMWWIIEEHPKTTIQNKQDGFRIANNTLGQEFNCKTDNRRSLASLLDCTPFSVSFVNTRLVVALVSVIDCTSTQWHSEAASSSSVGAALWTSKSNLDDPRGLIVCIKKKRIKKAGQAVSDVPIMMYECYGLKAPKYMLMFRE